MPAALETGEQTAEPLLILRLGELPTALFGEPTPVRTAEEGLDALRDGSHDLNVPSRGAAESWWHVTFRVMLDVRSL